MLERNEILERQEKMKNNIFNSFMKSETSEELTITEEAFEKAKSEMKLDYFTEEGLNAFKAKFRTAVGSGKVSVEQIEKAKKDVSKLRKLQIVNKGGKLTTVYVKNSDLAESHKELKDELDKKQATKGMKPNDKFLEGKK